MSIERLYKTSRQCFRGSTRCWVTWKSTGLYLIELVLNRTKINNNVADNHVQHIAITKDEKYAEILEKLHAEAGKSQMVRSEIVWIVFNILFHIFNNVKWKCVVQRSWSQWCSACDVDIFHRIYKYGSIGRVRTNNIASTILCCTWLSEHGNEYIVAQATKQYVSGSETTEKVCAKHRKKIKICVSCKN